MNKATIADKELQFEYKGEQLYIDGEKVEFDLKEWQPQMYNLLIQNKSMNLRLVSREGKTFKIEVNGTIYELEVQDKYDLLLEKMGLDMPGMGAAEDITAPMPGLVLEVLVESGQEVSKDQPLVILEAMKMENVLKAPADTTVNDVLVSKNQTVNKNELLVTFSSSN